MKEIQSSEDDIVPSWSLERNSWKLKGDMLNKIKLEPDIKKYSTQKKEYKSEKKIISKKSKKG